MGSVITTCRSTPPPGTDCDEITAEYRRENAQVYYELIEMGGRPAYPLEISIAGPGNYGEYAKMIDYWGTDYLGQKGKWIYFRNFQRRRRRNAEVFDQYKQEVHEYRQNEGIEGDIQLLFDVEQQTKVDEWKEFHYFQHKKLAGIKAKAEEGRQTRERKKTDWEVGNGDPEFPPELFDWRWKAETDVDKFMILLNWIEEQLPKIAQEHGISDDIGLGNVLNSNGPYVVSGTGSKLEDTEPADSITEKKSARRSTNKTTKKPWRSFLRPADASRVSKASNKKQSREEGRSTRSTRAKGKSAAKPPSEAVPLRRSQRLIDLAKRRVQQPESIQEVVKSEPKPRKKPTPRLAKRQNSSTPAKPQGIKKSPGPKRSIKSKKDLADKESSNRKLSRVKSGLRASQKA